MIDAHGAARWVRAGVILRTSTRGLATLTHCHPTSLIPTTTQRFAGTHGLSRQRRPRRHLARPHGLTPLPTPPPAQPSPQGLPPYRLLLPQMQAHQQQQIQQQQQQQFEGGAAALTSPSASREHLARAAARAWASHGQLA